ncbi:hypothetical protein [Sulfurospirillum sp. SCADC]|uniref:hypothetical protein n=1 Tax=Sulfurospirillum sp. SCADC TaxID=1537915 RepID=UPI000AF59D04|nr:hypothetical protein [Sulfurospirillum sp. SCADC]
MLDDTHCLIMLFALAIGYALYLFTLKPLNKRYETALDYLVDPEKPKTTNVKAFFL